MHWETSAGVTIQAPTFPLIIPGVATDLALNLVTDSGEELTGAYLYVLHPEYYGYAFARRHTESDYRALGIPFDANCYLGYIADGSQTAIDIRLLFPTSAPDGPLALAIAVGHDDAAELPNPYFLSDWPELWAVDWADQKLWNGDWQL
jgi:hypothetical protein